MPEEGSARCADGMVRVATFPDGRWIARVTTIGAMASLEFGIRRTQWNGVEDPGSTTCVFVLFDDWEELSVLSVSADRVPVGPSAGTSLWVDRITHGPGTTAWKNSKYLRGFLYGVLFRDLPPKEYRVPGNCLSDLDVPAICRDDRIVPGPVYARTFGRKHSHADRRRRRADLNHFSDHAFLAVIDDSPLVSLKKIEDVRRFAISIHSEIDGHLEVSRDESRDYGFRFMVTGGGQQGSGSTLEEALRMANLWIGASEWPSWLEESIEPEHRPVETLDLEAYFLIGEKSPLLWPLDRFLTLLGG